MPAKQRFRHVDSARGLACILAILGHLGTRQFDFYGHPAFAWMGLVTRSALPTFMTLFGAMIAVVYLGKLLRGDPQGEVPQRLISRAVTCYLVYGAITAAALVSGKTGIGRAVEAMLFVDTGRFGEVLKNYAVLFLVMLALLPLLRRWGAATLVVAAAAFWVLRPVVAAFVPPGHFLVQFLIGYDGGFGPAVLLCVTFVAFGALLGEALAGRRSYALPVLAVAAACAMLGLAAWDRGALELARDMGGATLRQANHPLYFAFGIVASAAVIGGFGALWRWRVGLPAAALCATIGRRSLFFYGFGNVALNLLPVVRGQPFLGFTAAVAFLVVMVLLTLDLSREDSLLDRACGGFLTGFRRRYDRVMEAFAGRLAGHRRPDPEGARLRG